MGDRKVDEPFGAITGLPAAGFSNGPKVNPSDCPPADAGRMRKKTATNPLNFMLELSICPFPPIASRLPPPPLASRLVTLLPLIRYRCEGLRRCVGLRPS